MKKLPIQGRTLALLAIIIPLLALFIYVGLRSGPLAPVAVTVAIVLWNTVYLERAANALRSHGQVIDDSLLQCLSPLGWEHINLTGDYLWRSSAKIGAGKFRPLRPLQPA